MNWSEYSKPLFEKCKEKEIPFHACFELTPFCNFKCNMCYIRLDSNQAKAQGSLLNTQQWIQIANEAKKNGTITLEITGGEAVTRSDFSFLYESFIKMGFLIHLRTNGYLIKGDILRLLVKYKPRKISVTLYGASDETYKKVCDVPDGFTVVTKNVLEMVKLGLNVRLSMTVTKDNVDDLEALDKWAKDNGLFITPFGALFTPIRGAKRSIDHLQVSLLDEDLDDAPEDLQGFPSPITDKTALLNPFWLCKGFGAVFCISWDGRMTLCNTLTNIWKSPIEKGLHNAYHELYEDLKKVKRPKECVTCKYIEYCAACPSLLQSKTGNHEQTCDDVCKLAQRKQKFFALANKRNLQNQFGSNILKTNCDKGDESIED